MKTICKIGGTITLVMVLFTSCSDKNSEKAIEASTQKSLTKKGIDRAPKKGENVPNNMVCMVNDAYMGKQQIEVAFEGKMYYGCCKMCKEKIPKDEKVRYATDPHSLKKISKADAYIVMIGDNDEVAYFENKENYHLFLEETSTLRIKKVVYSEERKTY
ncbi:hypothetical protein ACNFNZ_11355 [Empedobacter brevis]|uniref:hypothetical protein n=1 Tax=Empedobacter brevis TaxID=247 RepID=UPI0023F2725C|nr:hypothetical protein [Empedobacter brevis]